MGFVSQTTTLKCSKKMVLALNFVMHGLANILVAPFPNLLFVCLTFVR